MGFNESLLFLKEHEEKAEKIISLIDTYPTSLSVFGVSGTGKSEVSWWISRKLYKKGISSHMVSLDRYYQTKVSERNKVRKETSVIGHLEMDWKRINAEFWWFAKGGADVLIFDGLYAGYIERADLKICLDGDGDSTYEFRKLRGKENPDSDWRKYVVKIGS